MKRMKRKGAPTNIFSSNFNQPEYIAYVVVENKIESGWEFRDDAIDRMSDMNEEWDRQYKVRVYTKRGLKGINLNPDDNAYWLTK